MLFGHNRIVHVLAMVDEIVKLGTDSFAIPTLTELLDGFNHLSNSALVQRFTLFAQPFFALFGRPTLAQSGHFVEMLDRMVEVNQEMHLLTIELQGAHQGRETIPNPLCPIGDKKNLIRRT